MLQVIFKSCKLIPVMIGGALIQGASVHACACMCMLSCMILSHPAGKQYTFLNVVAMLLMSVGLVLFNLADSSVTPNMDQTGQPLPLLNQPLPQFDHAISAPPTA